MQWFLPSLCPSTWVNRQRTEKAISPPKQQLFCSPNRKPGVHLRGDGLSWAQNAAIRGSEDKRLPSWQSCRGLPTRGSFQPLTFGPLGGRGSLHNRSLECVFGGGDPQLHPTEGPVPLPPSSSRQMMPAVCRASLRSSFKRHSPQGQSACRTPDRWTQVGIISVLLLLPEDTGCCECESRK